MQYGTLHPKSIQTLNFPAKTHASSSDLGMKQKQKARVLSSAMSSSSVSEGDSFFWYCTTKADISLEVWLYNFLELNLGLVPKWVYIGS
jgi:hypothetical protein